MALMDLFSFSRVWTDREAFPTHESDEDTVRADIQCLFDELKNFINDKIVSKFNTFKSEDVQVDEQGGTLAQRLISIAGDISGLRTQIAAVVLGQIPDGSLTAQKIDPSLMGWKVVDPEDLYLSEAGEGSVYGFSLRITKQRFWYAPMTRMVFWCASATVGVAADALPAPNDGVHFMPRLSGQTKYYPVLEQNQDSINYPGAAGYPSHAASIGRDRVGNGSYLSVQAVNPIAGEQVVMSGFYICCGG